MPAAERAAATCGCGFAEPDRHGVGAADGYGCGTGKPGTAALGHFEY